MVVSRDTEDAIQEMQFESSGLEPMKAMKKLKKKTKTAEARHGLGARDLGPSFVFHWMIKQATNLDGDQKIR